MPAPPRSKRSRPRRSRRPQEPRRSIFWRWRRGLFLIGLMVVASSAGVGYILSNIELPPEQVQAQTSFICAADVPAECNESNAISRLHAEQDRVSVRLDQVPAVLVNAVLAAEDRDFFRHSGVDPIGIARAAWADIRNRDARQGGSTITQQYVKNVYLTSERTLARKIKEAVLAVKVEQRFTKQEILERYLNTIYFGRGAYGVGAASRAYFGKAVGELALHEAAYLAGLIRAPEEADAARVPDAATARRRQVLDAMVAVGYIEPAERDAANLVPWVVAPLSQGGTVLQRTEQQGFGAVIGTEMGTEYFVDYVLRELRAKGFTDAEIYAGGLRIYTTLDMNAQRAAYDAVVTTLNQEGDPKAALAAVDENGYIRAMMGGRSWAESKVNLATGDGGTGRQAGSSMKPFVLAAAVKQGISVNSKFDAPATITIPRANAGRDWKVRNYGESELGILNIVDATRVSSNTAYAQLMLEVRPENVVPLAERMGITSPLDVVNALVLGTEEVAPLEMASAYSTLARGGVAVPSTSIVKVERPNGTVVTFDQPRDQVFSEQETSIITHCLRQVIERGTGTGARIGKPAAGKTGTAQENRDAWFVGYVPNGWAAAVWMGYDIDPATGEIPPMDDVHGRAVTGGSFPATIWKEFMQRWTDGVDVGSFRTPGSFPGVVLNGDLTTSTSSTDTTLPPTFTVPSTIPTTTTTLLPTTILETTTTLGTETTLPGPPGHD